MGAAEAPGFLFGEVGALEVALAGGFLAVIFDGGFLRRRRERVDEWVFRREHHISAAKKRVGACGENLERAERGLL